MVTTASGDGFELRPLDEVIEDMRTAGLMLRFAQAHYILSCFCWSDEARVRAALSLVALMRRLEAR